jgi:pyrroloquinoline-quinone synthase
MTIGGTMDFFEQVATRAKRWDVLTHPFYVRWSAGELAQSELSDYAGQYAHAVRALATATRHAAAQAPPEIADQLAAHAAEEDAHVALWDRFATAMGARIPAPARPETDECAMAWSDPERELVPTLVGLYAIEAAQPAISETKREGLERHYGIAPGPATEYFDVHAVRDLEHAATGRRLISSYLERGDTDALASEATRVLAANWRLLDGVERARGGGPSDQAGVASSERHR